MGYKSFVRSAATAKTSSPSSSLADKYASPNATDRPRIGDHGLSRLSLIDYKSCCLFFAPAAKA